MRRAALMRLAGFALLPVLALSALPAAAAEAFTVAQLQQLIQAWPKSTVNFEEVHESPWLSSPVVSRGTLSVIPGGLEKRVVSPRKETLRLYSDRIEWAGPNGEKGKQMLFSKVPAIAVLSDVMRLVVAGDLASLQPDFQIELTGDERVWSVHLKPRTARVSGYVDRAELQGTRGQVQVIIIERKGERTTTRIVP